ncbi:MAG TPA: HDOD domain-containing protein [Leptospiraceae bacterium]|nr:HDOD domain-containing protein [Leptospiraceae bacterium]HNF12877.1 HDOD domain-containing protein [Leptospiraceae bacterium]HNI97328.1 HDOD domain-containing protein [Leptospiraceae bacterium]HNM02322.1 HDOD domain-containing protein [Leptospiraceae bacterium]HNN03989.1 HDOD domain-containing protein [Leptospiraceae bacterium]
MKEVVDEYLKEPGRLPSMSQVVLKVMNLVQDPSVSMQLLAAEISKDPAITAAIIKISNSAYYRASRPIRTVHEALMTLGIQTVKEIVLISASKGILHKDLKGYQLEAEDVWVHSLIVAELSCKIAEYKKINIPKDLIFTAGLLHDIGKVILAQFFPMKIMEIKDELKNAGTTFTEIEKKYFGYDHQEIGEKVMGTWNFPDELKEVVAYHHNPEDSTKFPQLVSIVHIANTLAIVTGFGIDIGGINHELSPFAMKQVGFTDSDIEYFYTNMPDFQKNIAELVRV